MPINPRTGGPANPADPRTGADFATAVAAADRYELDGVGVILTRGGGLTGVDLDACRAPATGALSGTAPRALELMPGTYAEASPSGRGVRLFVDGELPAGCRNRSDRLEVYSHGRYLTVTGAVLPGRPLAVTAADGGLDRLVAEFLHRPALLVPAAVGAGYRGEDATLVSRATVQPGTGPRLLALLAGQSLDHRSRSEADYELCRIVGFWCGGDPLRTERIIRASRAYRPKWDTRRGDTTWIARTIERAIGSLPRVYSPVPPRTPPTRLCADKSVSPGASAPSCQREHLLAHFNHLRRQHGRPVGLSVRQAMCLIGASRATAARRLNDLVESGQLLLVSRGNYRTGLASVFDLPAFSVALQSTRQAVRPTGSHPGAQPGLPPYTRTPGGLVAVWWWSPWQERWLSFGACPDREQAAALVGRQAARRSGWWSVGAELWRYARGRRLQVDTHARPAGAVSASRLTPPPGVQAPSPSTAPAASHRRLNRGRR